MERTAIIHDIREGRIIVSSLDRLGVSALVPSGVAPSLN